MTFTVDAYTISEADFAHVARLYDAARRDDWAEVATDLGVSVADAKREATVAVAKLIVVVCAHYPHVAKSVSLGIEDRKILAMHRQTVTTFELLQAKRTKRGRRWFRPDGTLSPHPYEAAARWAGIERVLDLPGA